MRPMITAPKDGSCVLIKHRTWGFSIDNQAYRPTGTTISLCRWEGDKWGVWCGNAWTKSTEHIDPIGWWPEPDKQQEIMK